MNSLRGSHAGSNRTKTFKGIDAAPPISGPVQVRYQYGAKQRQLRVGRRTGGEDVKGLFAIGAAAEAPVFVRGVSYAQLKATNRWPNPNN